MPITAAPNLFPPGYMTQFIGVGDDVADGVEAGGDLITLSSASVETKTLEFQFIIPWYLAGGAAIWEGAELGDWVKFHLKAPATAGTSNPGAGAFLKYPVAGVGNVFVPHPTQQGDWDLDLEETLNSHVDFTKVVPVPAPSETGFFDWDEDTGAVAFNATQTGKYSLIDQAIDLHAFVQKVPILGDSMELFTVPAIKPYLVLPHWKVVLSMYNSTAKTLNLGAVVYRGIK